MWNTVLSTSMKPFIEYAYTSERSNTVTGRSNGKGVQHPSIPFILSNEQYEKYLDEIRQSHIDEAASKKDNKDVSGYDVQDGELFDIDRFPNAADFDLND